GNRVNWTKGTHMPVRTRVERRQNAGSWSLLSTPADGINTALHSAPSVSFAHTYRVRHETLTTPTLTSDWVETNQLSLAAPPAAPTGLGPTPPWTAAEARELSWTHVPTDGAEQQAYQI